MIGADLYSIVRYKHQGAILGKLTSNKLCSMKFSLGFYWFSSLQGDPKESVVLSGSHCQEEGW